MNVGPKWAIWLTAGTFLRPVSAQDVTYYKHVAPILRRHCTICHCDDNVDELDVSGGVSLSSPDSMFKLSKSTVLAPGKPDASRLYTRIIDSDPKTRMPKDDEPLSSEKITTLRRWIETGCALGVRETSRKRRERTRPLSFHDLQLPVSANVPPGFAERAGAGRLSLVSRIAPLAPVTALAFHPSGKLLASGAYRRVIVWNLEQAKPQAILTDPIGMVHALEFTPDGQRLWLAGGDPGLAGELRAYRTSDFRSTFHWQEASDVEYALAISPTGKHVAASGYDRYLRVFELPDGKLKYSVRAHSDFAYAVAFSRDGTGLVTGGKDNAVKLWDAASGKLLQTLNGHNQEVLAVLFSPDGKAVYSSGREPQIRRWEVSNGGRPRVQGGHGGIVYRMAWNYAWTRFVSGGTDQTVRLWRPDASADKVLSGASDAVYAVALSSDGKIAAAGTWDGYVRLWDVARSRVIATMFSAEREDAGPPDWLIAHPAGYFAASTTFAGRSRWSVADGPVAYAKVAAVLERPTEVAKALQGAELSPVVFPTSKPDAPAKKTVAAKPAVGAGKVGAPGVKPAAKNAAEKTK
jgi:WD40 repeat protein